MADEIIAAVGRIVIEAREELGWSQLQLSKETGIFLEPLALLESGEQWMPDDSMELIEEALGWQIGITRQIREEYDYADIEFIKLIWVRDPRKR
ncbi:helix-turn-helix transcriptional regulator [Paenarthrobacter sp. NPDC089316]|uniref:helix-turn-helix domain-containing protein n=1 Tax=unclassified Paenarthrobacter TaxID=2634190 RepID=UPI00342864D0